MRYLALKNKDSANAIILDEYTHVGIHWIPWYVLNIEIIYFHSFGAEYVPKEIEKLIGHENIQRNIFRIQAHNSIMCGYFRIGFSGFIRPGKTLIDHTSLFSPYNLKQNW